MKNLNCAVLMLLYSLLLCTSCASENDVTDLALTDIANRESYVKYVGYSEKPVVSILDVALGKTAVSRGEDCIVGFTEEDVAYFNSLDEVGLLDLKAQLMAQCGFESDEDIEAVINQTCDEVCANMSDEELVKFYDFLTEYIEMPSGFASIESLNVLQPDSSDEMFNDICISAAVGVDNFGRVLYDSLDTSNLSVVDCKRNFAIRIAITSVSTIAGMIIPGPGWAVIVAAVCDAASAAADYANCLNHVN